MFRLERLPSAATGALTLLMCSGMHIAAALYNEIRFRDNEVLIKFYTVSGWYLGAIAGGLFCGILSNFVGRRSHQIIAVVLLLVNGTLLISSNNPIVQDGIAEPIGGAGFGIIYVTYIMYSSEITIKKDRGFIVSLGVIAIFFGATFYSFLSFYADDNSRHAQTLGIFTLLETVLASIFIWLLADESPIYLLMKNRDEDAKQEWISLRYDDDFTCDDPSATTEQEFQDLKTFAEREPSETNLRVTLKAVFFIILYRIPSVLTFNYPLNLFMAGTYFFIDESLIWMPMVLFVIRVLISYMTACCCDTFGRRKLMMASTMITAVLLIVIGSLYSMAVDESNFNIFVTIGVLFILLQLSVGFGILALPDVISSEVLPIKWRSLSIAFCCSFEYLLQIVFIVLEFHITITETRNGPFVLSLTSGLIVALISVIIYLTMPETKKLSLADSVHLFTKKIITKQVTKAVDNPS